MIIAGEESGDLHGSGVVRALKQRRPDCSIYGIGGDRMQKEGMELVYHVRELSVMGFWEVLRHLPLIRSVERTMETILTARRPDVLLLMDYPGFNLRFARIAKRYGIKIVYYISPQVWAWNPGRVKEMRKCIDRMLVVFPFEVDIYRKEGIDVEFVGHPLLEVLGEGQDRDSFLKRYNLNNDKPIVALLPGSRRQELERIFPAMLGAGRILHSLYGVQLVVGVSTGLTMEFVRSFLHDDLPVQLLQHATHDVMKHATVALVTSGTATLETGYYGTPMVIVYKTSPVTYLIGRLLVRIQDIGLINIVLGERVVPELLQWDATPQRLASEVVPMLEREEVRTQIRAKLCTVRDRLGQPGASVRVAETLMAITGR
jgi:lipid-A-disaccharide synthase